MNHKWENAMTIQKASWGYIRNTDISGYFNITSLIAELITTVRCVCRSVWYMCACVCVCVLRRWL